MHWGKRYTMSIQLIRKILHLILLIIFQASIILELAVQSGK